MQWNHKPALPGLVKVFLVFSYGWAASLAVSSLGLVGIYFFDRYILDGEALLWAVLFAVAALCAVFAIISIHTRNTSAPGLCRVLCILLIVLYALLAVRVLAPIIGHGGRFRFGGFTYLLLIPALLAAFIPFFMGWFRYFSVSPRISETFGIFATGTAAANLPPLGVGLLQVMCAMGATGNVTALLLLCAVMGKSAGGLLFSFLLVLLPGILFPLTLFAIVRRPGAKAMTVSHLLWAWAFFSGFMNVGSLSMIAMEHGFSMSDMVNFLWLLKMIPFPVITIAVFAAALSWRFLSAPEEGAWLRQPTQQGKALYARLPLAAFIIIYISFTYAPVFSISLVHGAAGLCLIGLGTWAASSRLNTNVPYRNQKNSDIAISSLFAVLLFISVVMRLTSPQDFLRHTLLYVSGDILCLGLCVYVAITLTKDRIGQYSPFAMPLPAGAFYLLCICTLAGGFLSLVMLGYGFLSGLSKGGLYHAGTDLSTLLFRPGFWLGSFIFPGIALYMFTKRVPNVNALAALCVTWLLAIGITEILRMMTIWRAGDPGFFSPVWFRFATILPLFVAYILNSKEFAAWRRPKAPPATAVSHAENTTV